MDAIATIEGSNSLADLAARIKAEHTAVSNSLKQSVRHGIAAGELLVEAKAQVPHGQWLPWLRDHVEISERTAQLYMRLAKNRAELEANPQSVADLTLNEAAAVLALSSNVKELFAFFNRTTEMGPEELISYCAANDIAVFTGNPFGAKDPSELDETEKREWGCYWLFLVRHNGYCAKEASYYADRLQSRGWRVTMECKKDEQWFGPWGDNWRKRCLGKVMPQAYKDAWFSFYESNRGRTAEDLFAEVGELYRQESERPARPVPNVPPRKLKRRRKVAA